MTMARDTRGPGARGEVAPIEQTFDTSLILAVARRAISYTETLAAATASLTSKRKVTLLPYTGQTADEYIVVTRIATVSVSSRNLVIRAKDLNRNNFRIQLPPELVVSDVPLFGDQTEGVELTFELFSAAPVDVTIHAATLTKAQFDSIFGALRPRGRN